MYLLAKISIPNKRLVKRIVAWYGRESKGREKIKGEKKGYKIRIYLN